MCFTTTYCTSLYYPILLYFILHHFFLNFSIIFLRIICAININLYCPPRNQNFHFLWHYSIVILCYDFLLFSLCYSPLSDPIHLILFYPILSYHILFYPILPCLILSHLLLFYIIISYSSSVLILLYLVLSYRTSSNSTLSHPILILILILFYSILSFSSVHPSRWRLWCTRRCFSKIMARGYHKEYSARWRCWSSFPGLGCKVRWGSKIIKRCDIIVFEDSLLLSLCCLSLSLSLSLSLCLSLFLSFSLIHTLIPPLSLYLPLLLSLCLSLLLFISLSLSSSLSLFISLLLLRQYLAYQWTHA